jgi:glycosyltransferase involved in cell wall biosynthesis
MIKGFDISPSSCHIVPLSFNITPPKTLPEKEPFCLHISWLVDGRKNVKRLIEAADKYQFKLVLGGKLRNADEKKQLAEWLKNKPTVEYRGFLSEEEKLNLYSRAKVFALPSITEGVGIVALEAAALGCDIVVTNLGGPKEYYADMAIVVNPYNTDEIGIGIKVFIDNKTFQPKLQQYVLSQFSLQKNCSELVDYYKTIIELK